MRIAQLQPKRKGQLTYAAILDAALELASRDGLEGLTIGLLAERMHMSKSGVFAHFGSREDLQIAVIHDYHRRFELEVFYPSIQEPRGLPRLQSMLKRWLSRHTREITSGCIYISGAVEYDDRPGAIRDELVKMVMDWNAALLRAAQQAVDCGHLKPATDCAQFTFEARALILALHHDARFLQERDAVERTERALDNLIAAHTVKSKSLGAVKKSQPKSAPMHAPL
jgi:AcrR family transcriptional regulator